MEVTNLNIPFVFKREPLERLAEQHCRAYAQETPFPHVVIDDFLPVQVAEKIAAAFPDADQIEWIRRPPNNRFQQKKLKNYDAELMDPVVHDILLQFNSSVFVCFLEKLTGIDGLIPDPHFWGGGMHLIERGGFLKIHVDFTWHEKLKLDRRLNLLFYLNRNWSAGYGGHLELWDRDVTRCEKRILPVFDRCVIFNTSEISYHGHPDPLNCPDGQSRKSLALYYYSNGRPEGSEKHRTSYKVRPHERPYSR